MGVEMGAKIAVFAVDGATRKFFKDFGVNIRKEEEIWADEDAEYLSEMTFDLSELVPVIAAPQLPVNP